MKIKRSGECGNSPKNAFVEDFVLDLLAGKTLSERVADAAELPGVPNDPSEIEITHAISHGKIGAANGAVRAGGVKMPFAVFIEFSSAKATKVQNVRLYFEARD